MLRQLWIAAVLILATSTSLQAESRVIRLPLHGGRLHGADLLDRLPLPRIEFLANRTLNLNGLGGSVVLRSLDAALGDGFDLSLRSNQLLVSVDLKELPRSSRQARSAIRTFAREVDPQAAVRQQRSFGLALPKSFDPKKPLVLLVHGLNSGPGRWNDLARLLREDNYQVGYFNYPNDQAIEASGSRLAAELAGLRNAHPGLTVDVIAHSMGALVARWAVEGPDYPGGVDRLILLCPPNQGSNWTGLTLATELHEHYLLSKTRPEWSWTWCINDGLGEGADQLSPGSPLLAKLNGLPRRQQVRYTVIAGNCNAACRYTGQAMKLAATALPNYQWAGVVEAGTERLAGRLAQRTSTSDGAVSVASTRLAGVEDWVVLPGDHTTIYCSRNGRQPVAWQAIQDRLAR